METKMARCSKVYSLGARGKELGMGRKVEGTVAFRVLGA